MHAKEVALFLLAFSLAGGIINSLGIFSPVENMDVNASGITGDMADGILEVEEGSTQSSTDVSSTVDGWGLILQSMKVVKQMLSVLLLPGPFLKALGINALFADAVQIILNAVLAWAFIQFALNKSTKTMD